MDKTGTIKLNITPEHIKFYRLVQENVKHLDLVNETYKNALDSILSAATKLKDGQTMNFDHDALVEDILFESFGTMVNDYLRAEVDRLAAVILNYYSFMLIDLHVSETLIYLDHVNSNGILLTLYDNSHIDSIVKEGEIVNE